MDKLRKVLHFTHNDADALGCALVGWYWAHYQKTEDHLYEVHFCQIGDDIDKTILNVLEEKRNNDDEVITDIIISDIAPSEYVMKAITDFATELPTDVCLFGFDHHLTNKYIAKYPWFIVRHCKTMNKFGNGDPILISACELMMDELLGWWTNPGIYFYKRRDEFEEKYITGKATDCLVDEGSWTLEDKRHIVGTYFAWAILSMSMYDTWVWKNHPERYNNLVNVIMNEDIIPYHSLYPADIYSVACKKIGIEKTYEIMHDEFLQCFNMAMLKDDFKEIPDSRLYEALYSGVFTTIYDAMVDQRKKVIRDNIEKFKFNVLGEYIVGAITSVGEFNNELIEDAYDIYPWVDIFVIFHPNILVIGFRTNKKDVNVARIAKRLYNGGGHASASGANFKDTPAVFINSYADFHMRYLDLSTVMKMYTIKYQESNDVSVDGYVDLCDVEGDLMHQVISEEINGGVFLNE